MSSIQEEYCFFDILGMEIDHQIKFHMVQAIKLYQLNNDKD